MRTFVAGHNGMVGSAICRQMKTAEIMAAPRDVLDLENQSQVERFFDANRPDRVILAAAKVGGIHANNTQRADFIYNNLQIQNNVIHAAYKFGVKKLLFLGSSCIYPRMASQPIKEESLLMGPLEPTNEMYAVAKIAGIKMCEAYYQQYGCDFISVMPTNLYGGVGENFDLESSHVLPALIRRFHEAKTRGDKNVTLWGTGSAYREFMYVDDMASACLFIMDNLSAKDLYAQGISHINIGTGEDISIRHLAQKIAATVGFKGEIIFDASKPDGTPKKLLDVSRLKNMGWEYKTTLEEGIYKTYNWYKNNV